MGHNDGSVARMQTGRHSPGNMLLHGDVKVDVNPQITNGSSGSDVVVADPSLGYQMLSSIRGAPEDLRLGGVEL